MPAKVLLVSAPSYGDTLPMVHPFPTPPMGLCILKKELKKHGHDVMILDAAVIHFDFISFRSIIQSYNPNIIGFTCYYQNLNIIELAKIAKNVNKDLKIVLGGAVATKFGKLILESDKNEIIDYVLTGAGINEIIEIANDENIGSFVKIKHGYINKKAIYRYPFTNSLYLPEISPVLYRRFHYVFNSGCPYNCMFCISAKQPPTNIFSIDSMINEIDILNNVYGCDNFLLFDETLKFNSKELDKLAEFVQDKNITFWCSTRTDCINENSVESLRKLNVSKVYIGTESTKKETQKYLSNKTNNISSIYEKVRLLHDYNIKVETAVMIGLPFETKNDFENSLNDVVELGFDYIMFGILHLIPGTELYNNADKYGYQIIKTATSIEELFNQDNYIVNSSFINSLYISKSDIDELTKSTIERLEYRSRYGKPLGYISQNLGVFPF